MRGCPLLVVLVLLGTHGCTHGESAHEKAAPEKPGPAVPAAAAPSAVQPTTDLAALNALLAPRDCGCPCGRRLMDCFGCSVAKADLHIARVGLRAEQDLAAIHLALDAPLVLIWWGDYTDPACRRIAPAVARLRRTYGDVLKVIYRHLPIAPSRAATRAAIAAECAREQTRFWAMHDLLYGADDLGSDETLLGLAARLGLDVERFGTTLATERFEAQMAKDQSAAKDDFDVGSVPTFFLNGERLDGVAGYEELEDALDRELGRLAR